MSDDILARFPQTRGDPRKMAMLSQVMRLQGATQDAYALGLAAVEAAPQDIEIRDLVRSGLSDKVPIWHVPMLHDTPRNRCYAQVIERMVKPGMRVLEIGTGAGLLSLLCARAGAEVVTCEMNPMVAAAAVEVIRRNGLSDRIRVIAKESTAVELGADLPERADLLISELFDDMLFADGVMDYLNDARARLLVPGAAILPPRAELRFALTWIDIPQRFALLGDVEGFDLSAFNVLAPPTARQLPADRHKAEQRSGPVSAMAVDFDATDFGQASNTIVLRSTGGRVNGIAQWMRIDFGDGVIYENTPFGGEWSHWGAPVHTFAQPLETSAGDEIELSIRLSGRDVVIRPRPLG